MILQEVRTLGEKLEDRNLEAFKNSLGAMEARLISAEARIASGNNKASLTERSLRDLIAQQSEVFTAAIEKQSERFAASMEKHSGRVDQLEGDYHSLCEWAE